MVKKSYDLNLNVGVNSLFHFRARSQDRFNLRNDSQGRELDVRVDIFVVGVIGGIELLGKATLDGCLLRLRGDGSCDDEACLFKFLGLAT